MPTDKVLLIEDDPMSLELLQMLLEQEGFEVTAYGSGDEAVTHVKSGATTDIVLTDLQMPGLRGPALATALRNASSRPLRIFAMSATAPERRLPGIDAFLLKPLSIERFLSLVRGSGTHRVATVMHTDELDDSIFQRMAKMMQPQQLQATYIFAIEDTAKRIERMRRAVEKNDNAEFRKEAHAAKGGCAMVGAVEVASIASKLEHSGLTGKQVGTDLDEFEAALERLRRMLESRFTT